MYLVRQKGTGEGMTITSVSARALTERLTRLETIELLSGGHPPDDGLCVMEAVAWLAGETHSDHPTCACPVISGFLRRLNDRLPDDLRQQLKPLIPRLIGSRSTDRAVVLRRAHLAADWANGIAPRVRLRCASAAAAAYAIEPAQAGHQRATFASWRRRRHEELLSSALDLVDRMLVAP